MRDGFHNTMTSILIDFDVACHSMDSPLLLIVTNSAAQCDEICSLFAITGKE